MWLPVGRYGLYDVGFESREVQEFFLLFQSSRADLGPTHLSIHGLPWVFLGGKSGWPVKFTSSHHLVPTLRMNGAISPIRLHAFMAWTGQINFSPYFSNEYKEWFVPGCNAA